MQSGLPHDGIYARLGVSEIEGVGVFAIRPIPVGTNVFPNDQRQLNWIDASIADALPKGSPEKSLYEEFGVRRDGKIGCPANFNLLTVGWYLNEPPAGAEANIAMTDTFQMVARREIAEGEELTIDYDTFSDSAA
jgi:hypothetical protein